MVSLGGAKLIVFSASPTDRPARPHERDPDPGPADRPTRSGPAGGEVVRSGVAVQLSFSAPRFAVEAEAPRTPPRQPAAEEYASPYTRGRGICQRGAIVIAM